MSDHGDGGTGGGPESTTPPPPPTVHDVPALEVETPGPVRSYQGDGFELVQTVTAGGESMWTVLLQKRPTEKPEPVADYSAQDD